MGWTVLRWVLRSVALLGIGLLASVGIAGLYFTYHSQQDGRELAAVVGLFFLIFAATLFWWWWIERSSGR